MSRSMMAFQIFLTMVFFIGIGVQANPLELCQTLLNIQEEVDNIVKVRGEEEFNLPCANMTAFSRCLNTELEKQTGYTLKTMATLVQGTDAGIAVGLLNNMVELFDEICADGSELHEAYLANADCFQSIDDDIFEKCEKQAEDAVESFNDVYRIYIERKGNNGYCLIKAYELGCFGAAIHEECGVEGFDFFKKIVTKLGFLKSGFCSAYDLDTIKNGFADSLDISESRRSLYRVIFEFRKRRK